VVARSLDESTRRNSPPMHPLKPTWNIPPDPERRVVKTRLGKGVGPADPAGVPRLKAGVTTGAVADFGEDDWATKLARYVTHSPDSTAQPLRLEGFDVGRRLGAHREVGAYPQHVK